MHPAKQEILSYFTTDHMAPDTPMKDMGNVFARWALVLAEHSGDNAEGTTALRKLLEAKDCAVRSVLPEDVDEPMPDSDKLFLTEKLGIPFTEQRHGA